MKTDIVILAAGYGKRMESETPKVLIPLHGKPLIQHVLDAVKESGVTDSPVIVVGQKRELVINALGPKYRYAVQGEQLGTGHAVMSAKDILKESENVLVLYGDVPNIKGERIKEFIETHNKNASTFTIGTVKVENFEGINAGFADFGRIVRSDMGELLRIVEKKDATEIELAIKELNPAIFCIKGDWLWKGLAKIKNKNAKGEYYLTDLVDIATQEGIKIHTVDIPPKEALGVNTKENLEILYTLN